MFHERTVWHEAHFYGMRSPVGRGGKCPSLFVSVATRSAYIERFNRTFRIEVRDRYVFTSLHDVRRMTEDWRRHCNHQRPRRALTGLSPVAYAMASSPTSTSE
ncbi:transposase [Rhodanobacter sp. 7MK24]|nr:transposase [Rhodanobacter sp. 7MK24]